MLIAVLLFIICISVCPQNVKQFHILFQSVASVDSAYFSTKKHPGSKCFIQQCPFSEKFFFLNLKPKCQK